MSGWGGGGVRVDVNGEVKLLCVVFGGRCGGGGVGSGGGGVGLGVGEDVNGEVKLL